MPLSPEARAAAAAIDQDRLWHRHEAMAGYGGTPRGGVDRQALSAPDVAARRQLVAWGRELDLAPSIDPAGNVFLRLEGEDGAAPPVLCGSHLDSQPTGGRFDGASGVLCALEAVEAIRAAGVRPRRSLEVVSWTNEEGSRFQPGCMGSSFFAHERDLEALKRVTDADGVVLGDALEAALAALPEVPRRPLGFPAAAYLELHIEQGPVLERAGCPIAVVSGIQGLRWSAIEVLGEEAHAGTTPFAMRKDALRAAAAMVGGLEQLALADETDTLRLTVGRFEVSPGSPNTVPGRVLLTTDLRHPELATIDRVQGEIERIVALEARARGCTAGVRVTTTSEPTVFDPAVVSLLREVTAGLGHRHLEFLSGAGHDAIYLARVCPAAMIFVPCEKGISHNEAESAEPLDLAVGARVLAAALVELGDQVM
jgi:beta-ureidopropionase / N-carbamoyl-L-amino-acid hydrolase